jgi:hypothetical protein
VAGDYNCRTEDIENRHRLSNLDGKKYRDHALEELALMFISLAYSKAYV